MWFNHYIIELASHPHWIIQPILLTKPYTLGGAGMTLASGHTERQEGHREEVPGKKLRPLAGGKCAVSEERDNPLVFPS